MQAMTTPIGAINTGRLLDAWHCGSTGYIHPENLMPVDQYRLDRGMERYFSDIAGLKAALSRKGIEMYLDMGAGYGRAAEEIARSCPSLHVLAVSKSDFRKERPLPPNMEYLIRDARDAIEDIHATPDVIVDLYGAFTYDVLHQIDLISLYMHALAPRGKALIRFDGDHIGIVNQYGTLMLFPEWLNILNLRNIRAIKGPDPTGPTTLASVIILRKGLCKFSLPALTLLGIRQFADDIVPFVVYGIKDCPSTSL